MDKEQLERLKRFLNEEGAIFRPIIDALLDGKNKTTISFNKNDLVNLHDCGYSIKEARKMLEDRGFGVRYLYEKNDDGELIPIDSMVVSW